MVEIDVHQGIRLAVRLVQKRVIDDQHPRRRLHLANQRLDVFPQRRPQGVGLIQEPRHLVVTQRAIQQLR